MKKLSLKTLNLEKSEMLTREQLKRVLGGTGSGACPENECYQDCDCTEPQYPVCHTATCISTNKPSNTCGVVL